MSDAKRTKQLIELKNLVEAAEISLQQSRQLLNRLVSNEETISLANHAKSIGRLTETEEGQIIEGIFDGQNMVGPDGKKYSVPANYASKSKMVEGDKLKLTITPDGSFVYKQVKPIERERITGKLTIDEETGDYRVLANNKSYNVLSASVTYFKGKPGSNVTILIPKNKESTWAAVENIFNIDKEILPSVEKNTLPEVNEHKDNEQEFLPDTNSYKEKSKQFLSNNKEINENHDEDKIKDMETIQSQKLKTDVEDNEEFLNPDISDEKKLDQEPQLGSINSSEHNISEEKTEQKFEEKPEDLTSRFAHSAPNQGLSSVLATNKPENIFSAKKESNFDDVNKPTELGTNIQKNKKQIDDLDLNSQDNL